jgi:hypothetical protein
VLRLLHPAPVVSVSAPLHLVRGFLTTTAHEFTEGDALEFRRLLEAGVGDCVERSARAELSLNLAPTPADVSAAELADKARAQAREDLEKWARSFVSGESCSKFYSNGPHGDVCRVGKLLEILVRLDG